MRVMQHRDGVAALAQTTTASTPRPAEKPRRWLPRHPPVVQPRPRKALEVLAARVAARNKQPPRGRRAGGLLAVRRGAWGDVRVGWGKGRQRKVAGEGRGGGNIAKRKVPHRDGRRRTKRRGRAAAGGRAPGRNRPVRLEGRLSSSVAEPSGRSLRGEGGGKCGAGCDPPALLAYPGAPNTEGAAPATSPLPAGRATVPAPNSTRPPP